MTEDKDIYQMNMQELIAALTVKVTEINAAKDVWNKAFDETYEKEIQERTKITDLLRVLGGH